MKMENYKETNETEIIEGYSDKTEKESVIETGSEGEKGSDEKGGTNHTEMIGSGDSKLIASSHTESIDSSERRMHHRDNHEKEVLESEKKDNKSKEMDSDKKPVDMENKMHEQIDNETYNRLRHMKECIKEIRNYMIDIKEEELTDCPCKLEVPLDSLTDIFKHYGILCYCMVYHKKTVPFNFNTYIKAFLLEVNLIEYLYEKPVTIPEVYFGKQEETNARDKYVASYKTFFNEVRIHINCEQDIESLSYKYYKHYSKVSKDCSYYLDPLLFLLFKRRESERFFLVFGNYTKTIAGLRFALLLSLFNECCKESDEVLKICVRNRMAKDEGIFYDIKKQAGKAEVCEEEKEESSDDAVSYSSNSSLSKISDVKCMKRLLNEGGVFSKFASNFDAKITNTEDARKDCISKYFKIDPESSLLLTRITSYIYDLIDIEKEVNTWFSERQLKKTWENSVKKWAFSKNKDNGNSDMDNSMILQCSKYKKFEEGYLIFSMQSRKNERCMLKTCFLCLHAYRNTNEKIWIERICDLLRSAAVGKMKSACCAMTDNILEGVLDFTEEGREMLLLNVISIFERYHLEKQEDLIDVILRGFFTLTTHCKDSKTCDLCYNYTLTIYKKWKESKQGFFFKKNSKFSDDIYSSTLGVCDQSNHCDTFHRICRDILNSNDSVGNNVICRLENYHKKCNCQKMVYSMHQNDKSYCEVLLKHCMCGFKE